MTDMDSLIEDTDLWLDAIPDADRAVIAAMLQRDSPEEIALRWLEGATGADRGKQSGFWYWVALSRELHALLCGGSDYQAERTRLLDMGAAAHASIVGIISATIAPIVGLQVAVVVPPVALLLTTVGKVGLRAWCRAWTESQVGADPTSCA